MPSIYVVCQIIVLSIALVACGQKEAPAGTHDGLSIENPSTKMDVGRIEVVLSTMQKRGAMGYCDLYLEVKNETPFNLTEANIEYITRDVKGDVIENMMLRGAIFSEKATIMKTTEKDCAGIKSIEFLRLHTTTEIEQQFVSAEMLQSIPIIATSKLASIAVVPSQQHRLVK